MKWMLKYLGGGSIRWGKLDNNLLFNVLGDKSNPTRALTTSTSCAIITKEKEEEGDSLYNRLLPFGDPEMSMLPILDKWIIEERPIEAYQLRNIIKGFRKYKRFKHALQISQWMTEKSFLDLSSSDVAVQLDLISKVHGVEQAEEYFYNVPDNSKNFQLYGALLNCYADAKLLEKAEYVMQKIRDLGYVSTLVCNVMMNLYSRLGKPDKLDHITQEMEEKHIAHNEFSYNIRLNAYAVNSDMGGMEKLLMKMEADPSVKMDWHAYVVAVKGYILAGNMEKALAMLKKSEELIPVSDRKPAYETLMSLYASTGNKDEVYRIWNQYKSNEKFYNKTYLCAISSLAKLDDIDGAEKIFEEWLANRIRFDLDVPNCLITCYGKKGLMGKAESVVQKIVESGYEPNAGTWSRMAHGYHKKKQMDKAVESLNRSIVNGRPGWKPRLPTLIACVKHLKGKGDVDMIKHIKTSLAKQGIVYKHVWGKLGSDGKSEVAEKNLDSKASGETEGDEYQGKQKLQKAGGQSKRALSSLFIK